MSRKLQISLITLGCVAVFIGLRSLPVEKCEFLHYGEFINNEGVIEGCGYEETEFFNMEEIRFPIIAELTPLTDPVIGEPVTCSLTLFTTTGKPIEWDQIAVSHTERVHAMVVDPSLEDYQHVHPQPAGPAGHYLVEVTPVKPGPYSVYLDFIPLISSRRTLLESGFEVPGEAEAPVAATRLQSREDEYTFTFVPGSNSLVTGKELAFELQVERDDGSPTRFSPVMDSFAHVVAFDAAGTGFAHLHPRNPLIEGQNPLSPDLNFTIQFEQPGHYRIWAQFIVDGRHVFAPFDVMVEPA
ncbi:MAG: hypothetical protein AB3N33_10230 [Puniceicoccaceae bacterium]